MKINIKQWVSSAWKNFQTCSFWAFSCSLRSTGGGRRPPLERDDHVKRKNVFVKSSLQVPQTPRGRKQAETRFWVGQMISWAQLIVTFRSHDNKNVAIKNCHQNAAGGVIHQLRGGLQRKKWEFSSLKATFHQQKPWRSVMQSKFTDIFLSNPNPWNKSPHYLWINISNC